MLEKTSYPESVVRRCSLKKMFLKISQILWENTCAGISILISLQFCRKRDSGTVVFLWILRNVFKNTLFTEHFRTTASMYRNNMPRAFKTKCEKNESNDILITYFLIFMTLTYMWLNYNNSIHQTTSTCKNKAKPYQFISNHKVKIITFFIWPRGASENMFEVKYLVHLKVGG